MTSNRDPRVAHTYSVIVDELERLIEAERVRRTRIREESDHLGTYSGAYVDARQELYESFGVADGLHAAWEVVRRAMFPTRDSSQPPYGASADQVSGPTTPSGERPAQD